MATWRIHYRRQPAVDLVADAVEVNRRDWTFRRGMCFVDRPYWIVVLRVGHDEVDRVEQLTADDA